MNICYNIHQKPVEKGEFKFSFKKHKYLELFSVGILAHTLEACLTRSLVLCLTMKNVCLSTPLFEQMAI